jgi:anion-transporting  ArsA/GET3 family ATPase
MATPANSGRPVGWPSRLTKARLHFVTGKGGTGKSTIAASLALALAAGGRKVLLVELEGRQGIAQLFDVPPLPYQEVKIATADGGGQVNALAIDTEAAFLEYLDMFYNLGLAGRAMRRIGAVEFATTIAPGLRDVLLTGKIREIVTRAEKGKQPVYDAIVVDSPPTGRIARFLDVTQAVSELAKGGPVHSQAESVVKVLHSDLTAIHLVTLLEALPIQETLEAIEELQELGLPIGSVIVNRNIPAYLPADDLGNGKRRNHPVRQRLCRAAHRDHPARDPHQGARRKRRAARRTRRGASGAAAYTRRCRPRQPLRARRSASPPGRPMSTRIGPLRRCR